jgi:hypothetical protein
MANPERSKIPVGLGTEPGRTHKRAQENDCARILQTPFADMLVSLLTLRTETFQGVGPDGDICPMNFTLVLVVPTPRWGCGTRSSVSEGATHGH